MIMSIQSTDTLPNNAASTAFVLPTNAVLVPFAAWLANPTERSHANLTRLAIALLDWLDAQHSSNGVSLIGFSPRQVLFDSKQYLFLTTESTEKAEVNLEIQAYLSPEQTRKTNFVPDYRSDYFALGTVLYQAATGQQPFAGVDAANTVLKILTVQPPLASIENPAIPDNISLVINKLIAKNPDDRYQSADGLRHDLALLSADPTSTDSFIPGLADRPARLQIDSVVAGFDTHLQRIKAYIQQANANGEKGFVWIDGAAGTGKTTLLNQLDDALFTNHFVLRADLRNDTQQPFAALRQSIENSIEAVLMQHPDVQQDVAIHLANQVGSLLPALLEFCPAIGRLTNNTATNSVPLSGNAGQERLAYALSGFLKALMLAGRPVVWLFDSFQSASETTLRLLDALTRETSLSQLAIVVAVTPSKTASTGNTLSVFQENKPNTKLVISLGGLPPDVIAEWLHRLVIQPDTITETAKLIHQKTGGNPYYTDQLLRQADQAGFITPQPGTRWFWPNLAGLVSLETTENRLNALISRVFKLSDKEQELLGLAACWAQPIEYEQLAEMSNLTKTDYQTTLDVLIEVGLLVWQAQSRQISFANTRLPKQVLAVLPGTVKHNGYRAVADYLNHRLDGATSDTELFRLADTVMNLPTADGLKLGVVLRRAAQNAVQMGAFELATRLFDYLTTPIKNADWQDRFEEIFVLYLDYLDATAYSDDPKNRFDELFRLLSARTRNRSDTLRVAYVRAQGLVYRQRFDDAIQLVIQVVSLFGVNIPYQVSLLETIGGLLRINALMNRLTPARIEALPINNNDEARQLIYLLYAVTDAVFLARPVLLLPFMHRQIQNTLRYGLTPESGMSFMQYALIETSFNHRYRRAATWANLTHRLHSQSGAERSAGFLDAVFVRHWTAPLTTAIEQLHEAYRRCREVGQLTFAFYALGSASVYELYTGTPLDAVLRQSLDTLRQADLRNQTLISTYCRFVAQATTDLIQGNTSKIALDTEQIYTDWQTTQQQLVAEKEANSIVILSAIRLMVAVHQRHWQAPVSLFQQFIRAVQEIGEGSYSVVMGYYYGGLACLLTDGHLSREARLLAQSAVKKLALFSREYPNNNQPKHLLIKGLYAIKTGQATVGIQLIDAAIDSAIAYNQPLDKALAHEIKADYYAQIGQTRLAQRDWQDAFLGYAAWGAEAITERLKQAHPFLQRVNTGSLPSAETGGAASVELTSLLKMSNSIARPLRLENLLENLMNVLLENAGAQRATLLLVQEGDLWVYADTETSIIEPNAGTQLIPRGLTEADLPQNLIRYATRTAKPVALSQAYTDRAFGSDAYIRRNRTVSALAMPVVKTGKAVAVIYLENNAISGAFGQQQLAVLQLLSSQIVTSLENALLYNDLEQRVRLRTDELRLQKETSERLLLSILPETVADELKEQGHATARKFDDVTVLFTDFVNFSSIGEQMEPEELVAELDYCFRAFDQISDQFGLERIKTIGDAYLCVGGLPGSEGDHTLRAVRAAIAIRDFISQHLAQQQAANKPACQIRIGLHNGPVVAGVVGDRKFAYDIWGDTVNMASRMERNSEAGRINVSGQTWAIIKEQFVGTFRGKIMAKNKGEIEMYFVDNELVA
jgi:histidine kinase